MSFFSKVSNFVGDTVGDMVGDAIGDVAGEALGDKIGDAVGDAVGGVLGAVTEGAGAIADFVDDATPDAGDIFEDFFEAAGAPEWMGDVASGIANFATGNLAALASDAIDLGNSDGVLFMSADEHVGDDGNSETNYDTPPAAAGRVNQQDADAENVSLGPQPQPQNVTLGPQPPPGGSDAAGPPDRPATDAPPNGAATAPPPAPGTTSSPGGSAPATSGLNQAAEQKSAEALAWVNGLSNAALLDAVRSGQVPADVLHDPGAMLVLQQRLQDEKMATELMTQMSRALHDMNMAIAQKIRS